MALTTPDWLTKHNAALTPAVDGHSWIVYFGKKPEYVLTPVPVAGKHGCSIVQTVNGRRLPSAGTNSTAEDAIRGGLEDLRKVLGW